MSRLTLYTTLRKSMTEEEIANLATVSADERVAEDERYPACLELGITTTECNEEPGTNRFSTSSLTHFHHEQVSEPLYGHIYDVHTPSYKMDNITWGHNAIDDPVPIHGLSFCETGLPSRSGLSSNFVHAASRGSQVRFSGYASHDNTLTGKSSTTTNIQDWRWNVTDVKQVTGYCLGGQTRNKRDTKTKRSSASGSSGKIASRAHLQHSKNWKGDKSEVGRKYAGLLREYNECRSSFGHLKMCEATW